MANRNAAKKKASELKSAFFTLGTPSLIPFELDGLESTFYVRERVVGDDAIVNKELSPRELAFKMVLNYLCDFEGNLIFDEDDIETLEKQKSTLFNELVGKMTEILFPEVGIQKREAKGDEAGNGS